MKIIAVGWNYRGHNAEMNQKETPQNPIIFFKTRNVFTKRREAIFFTSILRPYRIRNRIGFPHFPIREKHSQ